MSQPAEAAPRHPMRLVVRLTGLSPHVLRVWERRHRAVTPVRSPGGQRLYSDADVQRLLLLRGASQSGHGIGQLVPLSDDALRRLAGSDAARPAPAPGANSDHDATRALLAAATHAAYEFDAPELERTLRRALAALGLAPALDAVVAPLLEDIGRRWAAGEISAAHEHAASAVVRHVLDDLVHEATRSKTAPAIVCSTPAGEWHELGAMLAAATAAAEGWRVVYLGPNLPAADIARAAQAAHATFVGLSIVSPMPGAHAQREIARLLEILPAGTRVLVGGAAARAQLGKLIGERVLLVEDLDGLRRLLRHR